MVRLFSKLNAESGMLFVYWPYLATEKRKELQFIEVSVSVG